MVKILKMLCICCVVEIACAFGISMHINFSSAMSGWDLVFSLLLMRMFVVTFLVTFGAAAVISSALVTIKGVKMLKGQN